MKHIKLTIQKVYHDLRPSEKKVADYFLTNTINVEDVSLIYLEKYIQVSQPTIIRFVKKLGYNSFKQFKISLISANAKEEEKNEALYGFCIDENTSLKDLPAMIVTTNIKMLEEMLKSVSHHHLLKLIEDIKKARNIVIFSVENSNSIALDLIVKLSYLGLPVIHYDDYYMQTLLANSLSEEDLAIGISYSGESLNTLKIMKIANKKKAQCVAITNFEKASICKYANYALCTSNEQFLYGESVYSRCTQMAIVDMIYMGIILSDYKKYTNILDVSSKMMIRKGLEKEKV